MKLLKTSSVCLLLLLPLYGAILTEDYRRSFSYSPVNYENLSRLIRTQSSLNPVIVEPSPRQLLPF